MAPASCATAGRLRATRLCLVAFSAWAVGGAAAGGNTATKPAGGRSLMGLYVMHVSGDDAYTGYVEWEFLMYLKRFDHQGEIYDANATTDHAVRAAHCERWALWAPARSAPAVRFVNARGTPTIGPCPAGAATSVPPGVTCQRVVGTFSYNHDLSKFPFDVQNFAITVEDDGTVSGTDFCIAGELTGLSSQYAHVSWSGVSWNTRISSKCYPPLTGCVSGNETACDIAGGSDHIDFSDECDFNSGSPRQRVTMYVDTKRPLKKVMLRFFLIPLVVVTLNLGLYVMHPIDDVSTRYSAGTGLLLSTVLFHYGAAQISALRSAKLSLFDQTMIMTYGVIAVGTIFNLLLFKLNRRFKELKDKKKSPYRRYVRALNLVVWTWTSFSTFVGAIVISAGSGVEAGMGLLCTTPAIAFAAHLYLHKDLGRPRRAGTRGRRLVDLSALDEDPGGDIEDDLLSDDVERSL